MRRPTQRALQERAHGELEARRKAVDSLVEPIRESLQKVDGKLGEIERTRESAYSALNEQLRGLVETHLPMLHGETAKLVKALHQPAARALGRDAASPGHRDGGRARAFAISSSSRRSRPRTGGTART